MVLMRLTIFLLLIAAGACAAFYVGTGQPQFARWGLRFLKWALIAGLGFFGVLVLERLL